MREKTNIRTDFKAVGEKRRGKISPVAALLFCLSLLGFGCAGVANVSGPGNPNADIHLDGVILEGKTIKAKINEPPPATLQIPSPTPPLLPSNGFWFASNDDKSLIYGWDEVIYRERARNVSSCNHPTASAGCRECRLCAGMCNDNSFLAPLVPTVDEIAALEKKSGNGQSVSMHDFFTLTQGCLNRPPNSFTVVQAEDKTVYELRHVDFVASNGSNFQKSVFFTTHVVSNSQDLPKDMVSYTDAADPNTVRFKFTMPESDGKLDENFSINLRIGKVQFWLGTKNTGTDEVMYSKDPAALRKARPSQILFLPNYAGGSVNAASSPSVRCYLDPNADDGAFDLTDCRSNPPNGANPGEKRSHNVTPTYINANATKRDTLTWFAEYKTSDGLPPAEAFAANEFPVIVWTIIE